MPESDKPPSLQDKVTPSLDTSMQTRFANSSMPCTQQQLLLHMHTQEPELLEIALNLTCLVEEVGERTFMRMNSRNIASIIQHSVRRNLQFHRTTQLPLNAQLTFRRFPSETCRMIHSADQDFCRT